MSESDTKSQVITGRKVFFVNPNLTIFPESLCEDFLEAGYECYFVMKDNVIPLETKFEILIKTFTDIVLFFNIDAPDPKPGVTWLQFIKGLGKKYEGKLPIGIMYSKRPSKYEADNIGFLYENEARATCGAYMLEYDKRKNFITILAALVKIGAQGRRKNVRVVCSSNCIMHFTYNEKKYFINIIDMSLSHFTGMFEDTDLKLDTNERLRGIEFNIKGAHFGHDGTLLIKRAISDNKELCVFAFTNKNGQPGLESNVQDMLVSKLYLLLTENFNKTFKQIYEETQQK